MSTLTLQPDESTAVDCYISNGANANTAFNGATLVMGSVFALGNTTFNRALLRFDLSDLPGGALLTSAVLTIAFGASTQANPSTYRLYRLTNTSWTEAATWNSPWTTTGGDYTTANSDSYIYAGSGSTLVFDELVPMLNAALDAGLTTFDVIVVGPEQAGASNYTSGLSSADSTPANRPSLVINYESSVHLQCAAAVRDEIRGLDLVDLLDASVKVRKLPHYRKDDDSLPLALVTTHLPVTTAPATNLRDDVTYPITISLFDQSDGDLTLNQSRMLVWREQIRKHFHQKRLPGVDSVWMCNIPQSQPFNEAWFVGGMKDQSPLTLNFISRESRS